MSLPSDNLFHWIYHYLVQYLAELLLGSLLGWFNGFAVTKFNVPPFVATLAMLTIARGFTMLYTNGHPISNLGNSILPLLVQARVLVYRFRSGLRQWWCYCWHLRYTKNKDWAAIFMPLAGNEQAAKLSGININKVKITVYAMAGALAALGGIIVTARLDSAQPNAGISYELDAIAAVVIGGTSLSGGKGSIWGTVMGAVIIGVLNNGLVLLNVSPFWQQVVKGGVILLAVIIDKMGENRE